MRIVLAALLVTSTLAGCGGDEPPPPPPRPTPALQLLQYDACRLVTITEIADMLSAGTVNPYRRVTPGAPAQCEFGMLLGGTEAKATVTVTARSALEAIPAPQDLTGAGDGARFGTAGDTTVAQTWLGDIAVTVKITGQSSAFGDPAEVTALLAAAAGRLAGDGARLTYSGIEVDVGNPACALLATADLTAYFAPALHVGGSGRRTEDKYSCLWQEDDPATAKPEDMVYVSIDPHPVTYATFESRRPSSVARISGLGDAAFLTRGIYGNVDTLNILVGDRQLSVGAGERPDWDESPPRSAAADAKLKELGRRMVAAHRGGATPSAAPSLPLLVTVPPSGKGLWCCADGEPDGGVRPARAGWKTFTGDGFTVAVPHTWGKNRQTDGFLMVQLFSAQETEAVLAITDVTNTAPTNADPERMLGTPEDVLLHPHRVNYRRVAVQRVTYRGGRAVDWEGTYGGPDSRMHFGNRSIILPDGRQVDIHAICREHRWDEVQEVLQAALTTFDPHL